VTTPEGAGLHLPMSNRLPVGPGSRGGQWHDPEYRTAYHRAWKRSHPEYRERERLRMARKRAQDRGNDPADIVLSPSFPRPLPLPAMLCSCDSCSCASPVVAVCGFCRDGLHEAAS
jgi:hypothetical protein